MESSIITKIQDQLLEHLNKYFKDTIEKEVEVDKSVLTFCPPSEDVRMIMTTEFRKLLINDGLYYTGASNRDQLCIQKIVSHPIDYTDIRQGLKKYVSAQGISPSDIDMCYMLYYDETNNIKKFKLNEEKHKFNVSADTIFVLGGIEGEGAIKIEELKSLFDLQDSVQEVKSHNIYSGTFADCLKSERLERFLNLLIDKNWHIHFISLNVLYWSIVDILDTIDGFASQNPLKIFTLKALFYRIMKSDITGFSDLVLKYRYPNIDSQDILAFIEEVISICETYKNSHEVRVKQRCIILIEWLQKATLQKELVFIQDEEELIMLKELTHIYRSEISTWINSRIIMDNEIDVIYELKKNPISINGNNLNNYIFVDSKMDTMVQLSDVAVGIMSRYLYFIDQNGTDCEKVISDTFNENQLNVFRKLNMVLKKSRDFNPLFFNQQTSLEYHGLLNNLVDKYAV